MRWKGKRRVKNGAHSISDYYSKKRQNMDGPDTSADTSKNEK